MVTSPFSFPSGIPKPTVRTTSGNPSWVVRGFPPLRSQEWKGLAMPERQGPHCQSHRTLRGPAAADRHPSKVGGGRIKMSVTLRKKSHPALWPAYEQMPWLPLQSPPPRHQHGAPQPRAPPSGICSHASIPVGMLPYKQERCHSSDRASGGSDGVSGPDCHTDLLRSPVSPILGCPAQSSECKQTVNCRQVQA